jgi:hypothetical protein
VKHLEGKSVFVRGYRSLKEDPLSVDEVRDLARKVGGVEKLFSRRAMKYRQMGLHEREVSEDEMVRLMSEEYTFVTRPVPSSSAATARRRGSRRSGWTNWWTPAEPLAPLARRALTILGNEPAPRPLHPDDAAALSGPVAQSVFTLCGLRVQGIGARSRDCSSRYRPIDSERR